MRKYVQPPKLMLTEVCQFLMSVGPPDRLQMCLTDIKSLFRVGTCLLAAS